MHYHAFLNALEMLIVVIAYNYEFLISFTGSLSA